MRAALGGDDISIDLKEKSIDVDGIEIELSNQNKVLFPRDGYKKGDLVDYYLKIAPYMLP